MKQLFLRTIGRWIPSDHFAPRYPVSVKGICFLNGKIVLLKNEHGVWDLPGGKLQKGEILQDALRREILEELNADVEQADLIDAQTIYVQNQVHVLVLIFLCRLETAENLLAISEESFELGLYTKSQIKELPMHEGYRQLILHHMR